MKTLPIFVTLADRPVLLVGGGAPAVAKARLLLKAQARLAVVAPTVKPQFEAWADEGMVTIHRRAFSPEDLEGVVLAVAASGIEDVDRAVSREAQARRLQVNVVDVPALSTFIMPAIVDRDPVVIGISTHGTAPVLARRVRAMIEALLPARTGRLARFADSYRAAVRGAIGNPDSRRRFWEAFFDGPEAQAVVDGEEERARTGMLDKINRPSAHPTTAGSVSLVGAGPGDPDLLTLRAFRRLQDAEVIVFDDLVGPQVLDLARRDAERIYVGKRQGRHSRTQAEINALVAEHAAAGQRVVRLKGGDPFVFGRGGEEVEALTAAGHTVEVVPGITAAAGCAAIAGIPLTHRDHASAVTFISGRGREGAPDPDWTALAGGRQTVVIYMGVGAAATIAGRLIEAGRSPSTPVAVIENGTLPQQRILYSTLDGLGALVGERGVQTPSLIVIGEVVALAQRQPDVGSRDVGRAGATADAAMPALAAAE